MTLMAVAEDTEGFFLQSRPRGFSAHLVASAGHLREVRHLTLVTLEKAGVDAEVCQAAELLVSELVGNAVHACGPHVPLVVEVDAEAGGVFVRVHDPLGDKLPERSTTPLDDADAESGRGLLIVDALAPHWTVHRTPIGKQIVCPLGGYRV
jgi:anti-sigma regulatory factor (Ser/Thr protein kinase)